MSTRHGNLGGGMRVAVSMRTVETEEYKEIRDAISHDWVSFLEYHGFKFILVPNMLSDPIELLKQMSVDLILLTNGENIGENSRHDETEYSLLKYAENENIPVLGVCRGMQVMNSYYGGRVVNVEDHVATEHSIKISNNKIRDSWVMDAIVINSFHKQGITLESSADSLEVLFATEDGVVEACMHKAYPMLAIQWHPERAPLSDPVSHKIVETWVRGLK